MSRDVETVERLLEFLSTEKGQETVEKLIQLLGNLEESGLLDLLIAVTDKDVIDRLMAILIQPGTMRLADKLDTLMDTIGNISQALTEPAEPITLTQALAKLKDPTVARGLARLIMILEALGRS
ncbi:MAG: DUF1641 domain-containing protein [Desulfurococcales archaeon]|nr:DUF1641 domain-containing protein [Desulfurococcales archaeon]